MPKTCGVPRCESGKYQDRTRRKELGLRPISLFAVPKSDDRFKVWKNALKYNLKKTQHICQLHFADKYIRKSDTIKLSDGTISCVPRDHWFLENDAVPMLLDQPIEQSENNNVPVVDNVVKHDGTIESIDRVDEESVLNDTFSNNSLGMECGDVAQEMALDEIMESHENVTTSDNPTFSFDDLKSQLCLALLPQSWAWCEQGSDILFTYFDRLDFSVRLHLVIHRDLSIHIRSISNKMIDLNDTIKSIADILSYMETVKNLSVCRGTDIENERRDFRCTEILDDTESYKHTVQRVRCVRCRQLRKKLLQRRKKVDLQKKYKKSKHAALLQRRKYFRSLQKIEIMKASINRLQAGVCSNRGQCAGKKNFWFTGCATRSN